MNRRRIQKLFRERSYFMWRKRLVFLNFMKIVPSSNKKILKENREKGLMVSGRVFGINIKKKNGQKIFIIILKIFLIPSSNKNASKSNDLNKIIKICIYQLGIISSSMSEFPQPQFTAGLSHIISLLFKSLIVLKNF